MTAALTIACRFCVAADLLAGAHHSLAAEVAAPAPQAVTLGGIIQPESDDTLAFTPDGDAVYVTGQSGIWRLSLLPWLHRHAASATTDKAANGSHRRT